MGLENITAILDNHAGAITGIATVFLVLATLILAYFNLKLWLAQDKPHLIFTVKPENGVSFYIKNIGKGPAIDISFKVGTIAYSRKSLAPLEEVLIRQHKGYMEGLDSYINGVKYIRYKDINGKKRKQNPITYQDMCVVATRDESMKI